MHRWYQPATGRYTRPDPAWRPRRLREIDPYVYVAANPLSGLDPLGLARMKVCCNNWDRLHLQELYQHVADLQGFVAFDREDPGPLGISPWGRTDCARFGGTGEPDTRYENWSPGTCINACLRVHEQWHRDRCRSTTLADVLRSNGALDEGVAYAREPGCLKDAMQAHQVEVDVDPLGPGNEIRSRQ